MRIALFGGTFDPPHRGHVAVAQAAAAEYTLDQVLFAPAGRQPLKAQSTVATFTQRLAMCALACQTDRRFSASDLDAPLPDGQPNFTVDTLARLAQQLPGARIFALVGADSFQSLGHWREPRRLLELAEWIVVSRPGFALPERVAPEGLALAPKEQRRVHVLRTVHEDVAASQLRERLAQGEECADLLPAPVAAYIRLQGLYR